MDYYKLYVHAEPKQRSYPTSSGWVKSIDILELTDLIPTQEIYVEKDPKTGLYDVSKVSVAHSIINAKTDIFTYDTKEIDSYPTLDGKKIFIASELLLRLKELQPKYFYDNKEPNEELVDRLARESRRQTGRSPSFFYQITKYSCCVLSPECFLTVYCKHPITQQMFGTVVVMKPDLIYKGEFNG